LRVDEVVDVALDVRQVSTIARAGVDALDAVQDDAVVVLERGVAADVERVRPAGEDRVGEADRQRRRWQRRDLAARASRAAGAGRAARARSAAAGARRRAAGAGAATAARRAGRAAGAGRGAAASPGAAGPRAARADRGAARAARRAARAGARAARARDRGTAGARVVGGIGTTAAACRCREREPGEKERAEEPARGRPHVTTTFPPFSGRARTP